MEFDALVLSAAMAQGDSETRRRAIDRTVEKLREPDPVLRADLAWWALFRYTSPNLAELLDLVRRFSSRNMSRSLTDKVFAILDGAMAGEFTEAGLDAMAELAARGMLPDNRGLRKISVEDDSLRGWLAEVAGGGTPDRGTLGKLSGRVLAARAPAVLTALLEQLDLPAATGVVERSSEQVIGLLARELPEVWREHGASSRRVCNAVALAFLIPEMDICTGMVARQFNRRLSEWVGKAESAWVQGVRQALKTVGQEHTQRWAERAETVRQHKRLREPIRRPGPDGSTKDTGNGAETKPGRFGFRRPGRRHKEE